MIKLYKNNLNFFLKTPFILITAIISIIFYILLVNASFQNLVDLSPYLFMAINCLVFCILVLPLINFSKEVTNNYLMISLSLPMKRENIVIYKFINILFFSIFSILITLITYLVKNKLKDNAINVDLLSDILYIVFVFCIIICCIYLNFYFICRSNYFFKNYVALLFCCFMFFPMITKLRMYELFFNSIANNKLYGLIFCLLFYMISFCISYKIFNKRDIL